MADFGNQLEGATEGLDRFLDALDNAAAKLGSNAALETRISREEYRRLDQEKRFKKRKLLKKKNRLYRSLLISI